MYLKIRINEGVHQFVGFIARVIEGIAPCYGPVQRIILSTNKKKCSNKNKNKFFQNLLALANTLFLMNFWSIEGMPTL
jgi:hypothetical protein